MRVKEAVEGVLDLLRGSGFLETTIRDFYSRFYNPLLAAHGDRELSQEMLARCSEEEHGKDILDREAGTLSLREKRCRLAYARLLDYEGGVASVVAHAWPGSPPVGGREAEALAACMEHRRTAGDCEITRNQKARILTRFLAANPFQELDDAGIGEHQRSFLERGCGMHTAKREMAEIRKFLEFAHGRGHVGDDHAGAFPDIKALDGAKIPSVYSSDEIRQILDWMEKRTGTHAKRDYAIAVLVSTYGIRASDIAHMKAGDIDFERGTITIVQHKTGATTVLGLTAHAGRAAAEHVLDERPPARCGRLFLRKDGHAFSNKTAGRAIHDGIIASGVDPNGRKAGSHSLRFSRATALINEGHSVFAIARMPGHTTAATTRRCAQVDMARLSMCALEVPHA